MSDFKPRSDWTVEYPPGIIKYNDMFRHKLLDYDRVVQHLLPFYEQRGIKKIADFGCGTGTLLFRFEEHGFTCFGFDRHEESVQIASRIGRLRGSKASFAVGDMLSSANCGVFDATVQAFVPISFRSQTTTLRSMASAVRVGGLYTFMVVEMDREYPERDERMLLHVVENETCRVARIEPWKKSGNFMMWEPVLLVEDEGRFAIYIDHDELELYTDETWQRLITAIDEAGFRVVDVLTPVGPDSPPPWALEKMVTVERVEK